MKVSDVISALQKSIPLVSDYFTENFSITSIKFDDENGIIEVTTSEQHGLEPGYAAIITGVKNQLPVTSYQKLGLTTVLTFDFDHGYNDDKNICQHVLIGGTDNGNDGSYQLVSVKSSREIEVLTQDVTFTGNIYIEVNEGFDGAYEVKTATANQFTADARKDIFIQPKVGIGGVVKAAVRIAASADMDRFNAAYTKQGLSDCWLVITATENRISRSRSVTTDAISAVTDYGVGSGPVDASTYMLEMLEIYAVIPSSQEIAGRLALDIADEVRWQLFKSLVMASIPAPTKGEVYALMPVSDAYYSYLADNTTYTHRYNFERAIRLVNDDFAKPTDMTAPFRDVVVETEPCDDLRYQGDIPPEVVQQNEVSALLRRCTNLDINPT